MNIIDKDSWYHISVVNNPADIAAQVCKIKGFERWSDEPQFLYTDIDVSKFDLLERLKLVEAVVQNEAKVPESIVQDFSKRYKLFQSY